MAQVIWNNDIDVYNHDVMPASIAKRILRHLPIPDLIAFSMVSKNTNKAYHDPQLWVGKLQQMGLWELATVPKNKQISLKPLDDPLTGLDHIFRSPKAARLQVLRLYRSLVPYYHDLAHNQGFDNLKIFSLFDTPEDQARILRNLLVVNKLDTSPNALATRDKILLLMEIFENALLRELEIHYDVEDYRAARRFVSILLNLQNQQTLIDFFLQKAMYHDHQLFNLEKLAPARFFKDNGVNDDELRAMVASVAQLFNDQAAVVDAMFPESVPMMYKVCEELISNQLNDVFMALVDESKQHNCYFQAVPYIYRQFTEEFVAQLAPSTNMGQNYHQQVKELLDMLFELAVAEYMRDEIVRERDECSATIAHWNELLLKREQETTQLILKHVKVETKNDFLSSFKKVFAISKLTSSDSGEETYSEMQAKAKILLANIQQLTTILLPELVLETLNGGKKALHRLLTFRDYLISAVKADIGVSMQDIFIHLIETIGNDHLRPGFARAMEYLQTYNPNSATYTDQHNETFDQPLVLFFELINMADLIIRMIDIFYKEEFIHKQIVKHENLILNPSLQNKKKLEALVDRYVADGLNVALEILVDKIEKVYTTQLKPEDYDPPLDLAVGITPAGRSALAILEENMDLLTDLADRLIVDVFQQEIAERFFQIIVKMLKKSTVLVTGATNLISDLNAYCEFINQHIRTNKRLVMPLFQLLKKVGNIYLISGTDSKAIGKLVLDLSKFNGIFSQEEIFEFVQRRKDWPVIRRHVEKVMYGFGMGDCVVM